MTHTLTYKLPIKWLAFGAFALGMLGCGTSQADGKSSWETMEVTATSFTLAEEETKQGNVGLTAFGDQLAPSSKAIAVSRDLLKEGLTHGTKVRVEGLPGTYVVRDKMHRRWRNKIDILFSRKQRARNWGRQKVTIRYQVPEGE